MHRDAYQLKFLDFVPKEIEIYFFRFFVTHP